MAEKNSCIIVRGNPVSGFHHFGPFKNSEEANKHWTMAPDININGCVCWVVDLIDPKLSLIGLVTRNRRTN